MINGVWLHLYDGKHFKRKGLGMFHLQHTDRRIIVNKSSLSPLEDSQGQMTEVSPWKPIGRPQGCWGGGAGKKPRELEVPSDVMVLLRAGERDPQVAFRCSSFKSSELSGFGRKHSVHTKTT